MVYSAHQQGETLSPPTDKVSFYYNKIHFTYVGTDGSVEEYMWD